MKNIGKPCAGKLHARFDEGGLSQGCSLLYPTLSFSHLDQFLCMAFAQLTYRESLRDIETCLRAHSAKLYHLGIRGGVARSTLADANETRDWRIPVGAFKK